MAVKRRKPEADLGGAEELLREITENIRDVIWMSDVSKNRMLYISPSYERIWGRSRESLYRHPKSWMDAIHPDDRPAVEKAALTRQVRGGYDVEYRILRPDGSVRLIHDRAFPIAAGDGRVQRVAGLAEDITERRQADEARALRVRQKAERDLIAKVSHELRTPLTAIKGFAETLKSQEDRPQKLKFIETIERHADRLTRLVDNLMIVSLLEAGAKERQPGSIELSSFIADVAAQLEPVAARRGQTLQLRVPVVHAMADASDLHHVLSNLIDNAAKFSQPGGAIVIAAQADDDLVEISVRDSGSGIAAEELPTIFDRFRRGANAKGVSGAGLGLSIVRELVEAQGGRVWAENRSVRGACFRFTLPLVRC